MPRFGLLLLFGMFLSATPAISQSSILFGRVKNQLTGESLPGAHVFMPNTTYQTYADSTGQFILPNVPLGVWEIKAFAQGFEMFAMDVVLEKKQENQEIELVPLREFAPIQQKISAKNREKNLQLFQEVFLGRHNSKAPPEILLVNPEALVFERIGKQTKVFASEAIYFQNSETAYLITSYFEPFILEEQNLPPLADYVYFRLDINSTQEQETVAAKQLALFENSLEYQMIRLLSGETDSFSPDPNPKVFYGETEGEYRLAFEHPTQVTLENGQKITLSYTGEHVLLRSNGALVYPDQIQVQGEIESHSPVFYLPSDFEGEKLIQLKNLEKTAEGMQERIYLQTDRGYYWPKEPILFKAYLRLGHAAFADELSKVLHLEVLDDTGYPISHQVFPITNTMAVGFIQPKIPLTKGNYMLKAYTAWSSNYGDEGAFYQPFQVLDWDDFPAKTEEKPVANGISFFSDRQKYGANEKVTLNIMVQDEEGRPASANLSISVLDLNQTRPYPEPETIIEALELLDYQQGELSMLVEPEFGMTLEGLVLDENENPLRANVELLMNGLENRISSETDAESGIFLIRDRRFEGEMEIAMKATRRDRGVKTSKSIEIKRFGEALSVPTFEYPKPIMADNPFLSLEEISEGVLSGEIVMEEAVIEGSKEEKVGPMPYGSPDNIVDPSELQLNGDTQQFLFQLASRVPGMRVGGTPLSVSFRGGEPLVLINGIPAGLAGTPVVDILSRINVYAIERVEVVRRLVNTLGDQGRNGVISIITKTGKDYEEAMMANANTFQSFVLQGFPSKEALREQLNQTNNHDKVQRPVLYWNPSLSTDQRNLSERIEFTTGRQAGAMWIEIRGITDLGRPVYGRFLLNEN